MKILVIGSSGFIGQFLAKKLLDNRHEIIGLDVVPPYDKQLAKFKYIIGDILSSSDICNATQGVDLVITLAAKHHDFGVTREEFFKVNETGTQILLDCASKLGIKKLIFYSTVAVYGTQENPTTEETLPRPDNNYGESKLAAEKVVQNWCDVDNSRCAIIIRPTVIFGPNNYANMYNLIDKIYKRRFLFVGKGDNVKSVAYVANLADATVFLIDKFKPGVQVFNYSDEPQMTISQIVDTITNYMPHGIPKIKIPLKPAVAFASFFDFLGKLTGYNFPITSARIKKFNTPTYHKSDKIRELGFEQKIPLHDGFRKMVEWYLDKQGDRVNHSHV